MLAACGFGVLIRHRQTSQVLIRALFMELWGLVLSGAWGAGGQATPFPPSIPHPTSPNPDPSHPLSTLFVGLFHFDFMFAHLMALRRGERRHSTKDPMRRKPPPLPAHSHHIYIITHTPYTHTHAHMYRYRHERTPPNMHAHPYPT